MIYEEAYYPFDIYFQTQTHPKPPFYCKIPRSDLRLQTHKENRLLTDLLQFLFQSRHIKCIYTFPKNYTMISADFLDLFKPKHKEFAYSMVNGIESFGDAKAQEKLMKFIQNILIFERVFDSEHLFKTQKMPEYVVINPVPNNKRGWYTGVFFTFEKTIPKFSVSLSSKVTFFNPFIQFVCITFLFKKIE